MGERQPGVAANEIIKVLKSLGFEKIDLRGCSCWLVISHGVIMVSGWPFNILFRNFGYLFIKDFC
jgi:predicted RNA binding protein YcfA (HicA-like mRNA interferase family)